MKIGLLLTMMIPYLTAFTLGMISDKETSLKDYAETQEGSIVVFLNDKPEILMVSDSDIPNAQGEELGTVETAIAMIKQTGSQIKALIGMASLNFGYFEHNTFTTVCRYILLIFSVSMIYQLTTEMIRLFKFWG